MYTNFIQDRNACRNTILYYQILSARKFIKYKIYYTSIPSSYIIHTARFDIVHSKHKYRNIGYDEI